MVLGLGRAKMSLCHLHRDYVSHDSRTLPFDPASLEKVILTLCDHFNFRVILQDGRTTGALVLTTGLTLAGGLIGKYYGEKIGAVVGGAIGGACGLGVIAVTMREVWHDVKPKLTELSITVYDYLKGLGLEDYRKAATFLKNNKEDYEQLAMIIIHIVSNILGMKILSSLAAA